MAKYHISIGIKFISIILLLSFGFSKGGIDINLPYTDSVFACFAQYNATFVIVQAYQSFGGLNNYALQNLKNAKNRGFATDIFMSNCPGKDPTTQVNQMLNNIPDTLYEKVWIRVQTNYNPGCSWGSNTPEKNCQYLKNLAAAVQAKGKDVGIFSSQIYWNDAFHNLAACTDLSKLPLWYLYNDGQQRMINFNSFGGWTIPTVKTFNTGYNLCGTTVNANYKN